MRFLRHLLPAAGMIVVFLMAACSSVEPSATPAVAATAEAMVDQKLATIIMPTLTTRPQVTVAGLPETPTLTSTTVPTSLPLPTPTLTTREIFDLLDQGVLTAEEAAAVWPRAGRVM